MNVEPRSLETRRANEEARRKRRTTVMRQPQINMPWSNAKLSTIPYTHPSIEQAI
jgi:hypothetical protein